MTTKQFRNGLKVVANLMEAFFWAVMIALILSGNISFKVTLWPRQEQEDNFYIPDATENQI